MMRTIICLVFISLLATPVAAQKLSKSAQAAVNATPEEIARKSSVTGGELDNVTWISTEPFFQEKQGLLQLVNGDKFLRAAIDKSSGKVIYQLYTWSNHYSDWTFLKRMNYVAASGLVTREVIPVSSKVGSCSTYLGCSKIEHYAITIPREDLEYVAAQAQAGVDSTWKYKLFGNSVEGIESGILKTEVAGFLIAVDQEIARQKRGSGTNKPADGF